MAVIIALSMFALPLHPALTKEMSEVLNSDIKSLTTLRDSFKLSPDSLISEVPSKTIIDHLKNDVLAAGPEERGLLLDLAITCVYTQPIFLYVANQMDRGNFSINSRESFLPECTKLERTYRVLYLHNQKSGDRALDEQFESLWDRDETLNALIISGYSAIVSLQWSSGVNTKVKERSVKIQKAEEPFAQQCLDDANNFYRNLGVVLRAAHLP